MRLAGNLVCTVLPRPNAHEQLSSIFPSRRRHRVSSQPQCPRFVKDALTQWEPRIKVDAVLAEPDPVKGKLDLRIIYRIKDTHDQRSMVYPFYLLPPN